MNFGDILEQWDDMHSQKNQQKKNADANKPRKRLPNAPSLENSTSKNVQKDEAEQDNSLPHANPMDVWLRRYGVVDKDSMLESSRRQELSCNREYLKKMPVEATVDLHGLTRDEAWNRLHNFVGDCSRRGLQKILIVHGKGNHSSEKNGMSVLAGMVRSFIECDSRLGTSGHPDKRLGGTGATWVIIKKNTGKNL